MLEKQTCLGESRKFDPCLSGPAGMHAEVTTAPEKPLTSVGPGPYTVGTTLCPSAHAGVSAPVRRRWMQGTRGWMDWYPKPFCAQPRQELPSPTSCCRSSPTSRCHSWPAETGSSGDIQGPVGMSLCKALMHHFPRNILLRQSLPKGFVLPFCTFSNQPSELNAPSSVASACTQTHSSWAL